MAKYISSTGFGPCFEPEELESIKIDDLKKEIKKINKKINKLFKEIKIIKGGLNEKRIGRSKRSVTRINGG